MMLNHPSLQRKLFCEDCIAQYRGTILKGNRAERLLRPETDEGLGLVGRPAILKGNRAERLLRLLPVLAR